MRDPKRIKRICKLIEKKWSLVPDQRLGQFLENYVFDCKCIFNQEDNITEAFLKEIE